MSGALHLDMKSKLYVTAGRLSQEGGREHLKGLLQSLASKMLEKEAGGLPMLLRAAKEASGHHLVIFLCRSLHHRPQQEANKLCDVLKHQKKDSQFFLNINKDELLGVLSLYYYEKEKR